MHPKSYGTFEKQGSKARSRSHVIHGVEIDYPKLFAGSSLARAPGDTPLYGLYRYVRAQRVGFFTRFGHK